MKCNLSGLIPSTVILRIIMGVTAKIVADRENGKPHNDNCEYDDQEFIGAIV